jgi:hypothetical protein
MTKLAIIVTSTLMAFFFGMFIAETQIDDKIPLE